MKTKHTPAPWHIQPSDDGDYLLIKPIPGQVIAQVDNTPQQEANAKLIEAAPELLTSLQRLIRNGGKQGWDDSYESDMNEARAAVNKAGGEVT